MCGMCTRAIKPKKTPTPRTCSTCGELRRHAAHEMCGRCWQRHPDRAFGYAARMADRLASPPPWLPEFAAYVAARHCPGRACGLLRRLGRHLRESGVISAQSLLERTRGSGRSMGTLAKTLSSFLISQGLAFPLDEVERLAAGRRQRRVDAVPEGFRPAVASYCDSLLKARERARRTRTLAHTDKTIEVHLATMRDFSRFLLRRGVVGWASVTSMDLEIFLSHRPRCRNRTLAVLRAFFARARSKRLVLVDPAIGLPLTPRPGFRGEILAPSRQRSLFRRWRDGLEASPHECLFGLLALLHGASLAEVQGLRHADIDFVQRTVRLGRRPNPVPLDPVSWDALTRCLEFRARQHTLNPHVIVTRISTTGDAPASSPYFVHLLNPAGVQARVLRWTRIADLVISLDLKLVSEALGLVPEAVVPYLADHVQDVRLSNL